MVDGLSEANTKFPTYFAFTSESSFSVTLKFLILSISFSNSTTALSVTWNLVEVYALNRDLVYLLDPIEDLET